MIVYPESSQYVSSLLQSLGRALLKDCERLVNTPSVGFNSFKDPISDWDTR